MRVFQLTQKRLIILAEVVVNDDLGLGVALCHLDWPSAEDGYAADAFLRKHVMEDRRANKACRASEYKMHGCPGGLLAMVLGSRGALVGHVCGRPCIYSPGDTKRCRKWSGPLLD